jgi:hypothetical protein
LIYLGFITEGKLDVVLIKPSLGVYNWPVIYIINYTPIVFWHHSTPLHQQVFWRRCRGKRRLLQGEFRSHILYFVLSFALLYFYLHHFIKNKKKLVSFIVATLLLLGTVWMYALRHSIGDWHSTGSNIPNASVWLSCVFTLGIWAKY